MTTQERIDELRRLEAAATPGPWSEKAEATNGPTGICETCQSHTVKQADEANTRALKAEAERDAAIEEISIWKSVFPDIAPRNVLPDRSKLEARLARLEEAAMGGCAALAAAISLLERSGKKAAPSDKMFDIMLSGYAKALEALRAALQGE